MKHLPSIGLFAALLIFSAFGFSPDTRETSLTGIWVRKSDNLRIRVEEEGGKKLLSFIVEEGNEKFPCEVTHLPIYKNIERTGKNLWTCDFLVVTMGSCFTEYESGIVRLTKEENLEVVCPGFDTKYYVKLKPRLEGLPR